eukprot:s624_g6.t1
MVFASSSSVQHPTTRRRGSTTAMGGLCSGKQFDAPVEENEVILNVYDVGTSIAMHDLNNVLHMIGTGVYHASTQIGEESEWAYGFCEKGSGVFHCPPKAYPFTFRESINMGKGMVQTTHQTCQEITATIEKLKKQWMGSDYDLLHQNCCHFAVALCKALKVKEVPSWVINLAAAGAAVMAEEHALEEAMHVAAVKVVTSADGLGLAIKDSIIDAAKAGRIAEECYERDCLGRHKIKAKASDVLLRTGHLKTGQANMCCSV